MQEKLVRAYAKINWCIDVLGKRPDGYHEVAMVMQLIDLFDRVRITLDPEGKPGIHLTTNRHYLPTNENNLAFRAAESLLGKNACSVHIHLEKRIPVAAGLAGGSSNAAAVLLGLNQLASSCLGIPERSMEELLELGAALGADVPFCIMGQAALDPTLVPSRCTIPLSTCVIATGIGEVLTPIKGLDAWIVLSKPSKGVSTAKVYGALDLTGIKARPNLAELVSGLEEYNFHKLKKNMINILENATLTMYPVIVYTKNKMEEFRPVKVLMSGSGPTVFGVYQSRKLAESAFRGMKCVHRDTYLVRTKVAFADYSAGVNQQQQQ